MKDFTHIAKFYKNKELLSQASSQVTDFPVLAKKCVLGLHPKAALSSTKIPSSLALYSSC